MLRAMFHGHAPNLSTRVRALFGGAALLLLPGCPGDEVPTGSCDTECDVTTTNLPPDTTTGCGTGSCGEPTTTGEPPADTSSGGTTDATGTSSTSGTTDATGSTGTSTSDGESSSSSGTTEGLSGSSSSSSSGQFEETGVIFLVEPDFPGPGFECDTYLQDCPPGEKCMPWSNDGGGSWNALGCFPIDAMPVGVGQTCTVQGSGTSGIDNCELGAMCWDVDAETNQGTCVAMCEGSPAAPVCDAGTSCVITNDGVINLCLPGCDPLLQDCDAGEGCYLVGDEFFCAPDASGAQGADGDPCEFINVCDPGGICLDPFASEGCDLGFAGCCTSFCDLTAAGDPCPALTEECVPIYEMGVAPPGLEDVGVCTIV